MKAITATAILSMAFAASATPPTVSNVTMAQDPNSCHVTVTYKLSGDPGVVTLDIQTNYVENAETKWASIGPANMLGFGGDVHQIVQPTVGDEVRTIHWDPETYWPGPPKEAGAARAVVTAWATNAPPDYMIVHLVSPYDVTYYPHVEMVPGGITNIKYKGEYMPMRKIPAKGVVWWAGMPTNHANYAAESKLHRVMLTKDYYMAVYELTNAQKAAFDSGEPGSNRLPVSGYNGACYDKMRGNSLGLNWPTNDGQGNFDREASHAVDPTSRLGRMRTAIGLEFDLPTEHQWEYACRAGSPGTIYSETTPTVTAPTKAAINEIARQAYNCYDSYDCEGLTNKNGYATVGSYKPNAWGLYDMLGNVHEVCLDWFESWETLYPDETATYIDPVGPARGDNQYVVYRGYHMGVVAGAGKYGMTISGRKSMARLYNNNGWFNEGVRLCVTLR